MQTKTHFPAVQQRIEGYLDALAGQVAALARLDGACRLPT
jgi:hypothetical protein